MSGARTARRAFQLAALAALVLGAVPSHAQTGRDSEQRVREVHAAARPLDAHADVLVASTPAIYRTSDGESQLTIPKLVAGGLAPSRSRCKRRRARRPPMGSPPRAARWI